MTARDDKYGRVKALYDAMKRQPLPEDEPPLEDWDDVPEAVKVAMAAAIDEAFPCAPSAEGNRALQQRAGETLRMRELADGDVSKEFWRARACYFAEEITRNVTPPHVGRSGGDPAEPKSDHDRIAAICELDGCQAFRSATGDTNAAPQHTGMHDCFEGMTYIAKVGDSTHGNTIEQAPSETGERKS